MLFIVVLLNLVNKGFSAHIFCLHIRNRLNRAKEGVQKVFGTLDLFVSLLETEIKYPILQGGILPFWTPSEVFDMTQDIEILQFLHYNPEASRAEIGETLTNAPSPATLKRPIAEGKSTSPFCLLP